MYEEKKKKINIEWKSLIIKIVILLVAVFIILWLVSLVSKDKKKVESNLGVNLQSMKTVATEYFTGSRLPSNVNGKRKITLNEMFESKLLVEFKDQNNKACDGIGSYAEATKVNDTDYTIKVKLVCGSESDYIIDTVKYEDNSKVETPVVDNIDNNDNTTIVNKPNSGTSTNKPSTGTSTNKPSTGTSTSKPNTGTNNPNNVVTTTCNYGNKEYSSNYPLAYVIPGNCAVSKADYYKADYSNKVSSIGAAEYKKLNDEMVALAKKTNAKLYLDTPRYSGVYNKTGNGLVGYQIMFTMYQKNNYAVTTVYQYYIDQNGNRKVIVDRRSSIKGDNSNNNSGDNNSSTIHVTNVSLNGSTIYLDVNDTYYFYATITPSNATNKNISWSSSNTSVVTVNSSGKITALRKGTATITATVDGKSARATVYVNSIIPVSNIVINKSSLNLEVGETYTLNATVYPSNATNKNVSWSSSNTNVATISSTGKVTAKNSGSTLIRAAADGITTSIWVYVEKTSVSSGSYCKQKTQTDYFINIEEKNKYSNNNYTLEYYGNNMKNVNVINAGYVYDGDYDYIRSYLNNPKVTTVASLRYLDYLPANYKNSALKRENFSHNITQTYQKNGHWYIDVSYKVNNYNNVNPRLSNYLGSYVYYVPLFFQIEYIDLDDCISAKEYNYVSKPWEYKKI